MGKPKICEILGVEVNEEFGLKTSYGSILIDSKYYISEDGCFMSKNNNYNSPNLGLDTINGKFKIVKLPKWTNEQKEIFKALKVLGYRYIARDKVFSNDDLNAYSDKPNKSYNYWIANDEIKVAELNHNLFEFINWKNVELFEIPEV